MVDLSKRKLFTRRTSDSAVIYATGQRLPWAKADSDFLDGCTRCGKCIDACETNIIINGSGGFPAINFDHGECSFCKKCVLACPEPLFHSTDNVPWKIVAQINESCLSNNNVECRTCADECEPAAIQFTFGIGHVPKPKLDSQLCTGCGACLSVCPVTAVSITDCNEDRYASQ
ncbi:ferredoxin-type protein NapF [Vibrio sp. UCD-FRSSP16_10]|uniref:ferredoxin-type protein NapF n=1 Tax=unclassified Vibrio TaxID=2614977 RepID=UPI0007FE04BE|nr:MULTISPECIES: ferredoxin-type protein NapF [unclassified Vibrio]OBT15527.1 ferredoxin-type protein NapF [Vibrio sp. UCD-FRSSP16_30]OBT20600.1 ferredoxin-type protein NapF [Vibrio sp. UCD-FRSSP16_10]